MAQQVAYFLRRATERGLLVPENLHPLALDILGIVLRILLPFFGANFVLAMANQFVQHGFHPLSKPLIPKFEKLNPIPGFKRLFSARSLVEILKSLGKFLIIAWMAYTILGPRMPIILSTLKLSLGQSLQFMQETLFLLYRNVMIAMLALSFADFAYQRYEFEKGLRMTKQEIKEETKDAEGNPEIKGKQKSLMFASVMRRIRTQVPKATVVITNPTHFAVALKYDQKTAAPICVAKGIDHLALKIKERAKATGVPIVENRALARSLYRSVELDRPIPPELFQAVAQVLALVYRLRGAA
jgi:flagellar biosynthetic protein FlhB